MSLPNNESIPTAVVRDTATRFNAALSGGVESFDRWLADHDKQVRAKVLSGATDTAPTLVEFLAARLNDDERVLYLESTSPPLTRAVAEVEAKRGILEEHDPGEGLPPDLMQCPVCDDYPNSDYPCRTLRLLTLPYADHPDYRQEWKL